MTDIAEAMARGIAHSSDCDGDDGFRACVPEHCVCRSLARAAIRACHDAGGLVLREVPKDEPFDNAMGVYANERRIGRNNALAAVRALAVEVGE